MFRSVTRPWADWIVPDQKSGHSNYENQDCSRSDVWAEQHENQDCSRSEVWADQL